MKTLEVITLKGNQYKVLNGTYYDAETPDSLIYLLEGNRFGARKERLRFDFGDPKTGVSWNETYGTRGYVGRSMGTIKIPLLIPLINSYGGKALLTSCIIGVYKSRGGLKIWGMKNQ